ncbi:MAG: Si-specific NAD(P)(+) transhydrogenase [Myxococcales bacterium]|nr:Si-specific NAD(P)(+) transhydrogenase [Myxococcales bacterium]
MNPSSSRPVEGAPYDLVVIGCGPAGEKAAAQAAYFGKRVAVIDRTTPGGACVHTGTLPSKSLRESALAMVRLKNLGLSGMTCTLAEDVRVDELMAHKDQVCAAEVSRILRNLERHNVELFAGSAQFLSPNLVRVHLNNGDDVDLPADMVLIATGTSPHRPADLPFEHENVWDSDEVVSMASVPRSLMVYGAGVIGCEYATMFAALGVQVHLLEPRDAVLPFVDRDIIRELLAAFADLGITIHTNFKYSDAQVTDAGVTLTCGDKVLHAQRLLYAAGRNGNLAGLDLDKIGVKVTNRGLISVDEHFHTGIARIYAAGDIIGFPALASTSMDQGRVAVCHAFEFNYKQQVGRWLPYGIYTIPECSLVGATEQELEQAGTPFEIGRAAYGGNARAQLVGADRGLVKIVFDPTSKKLLGVHIVGERASELVHIGMAVLQHGGTIDTFIEAVYNYPTLSELFKYAAYDGLQRLGRRRAFTAAAGAV